MNDERPLIRYFTDCLCIWAHIADVRLETLARDYGDRVDFETHVCSVFPDTATRIASVWADRGGGAAMGAQVRQIAGRFDHVQVHPDVWAVVRPASSTAVHLFLKAARLAEEAAAGAPVPLLESRHHRLGVELRRAFFAEARDIATRAVQADCAARVGLDPAAVEAQLHSGAAAAALDADLALANRLRVAGSPTFMMNEGRQVLYGNVGYHLLQANVDELLRTPGPGEASWC